jgi:hypothetical protein
MDGTETGKQGKRGRRRQDRNDRYAFGRFTRQEAVLGLAALGLFYWGSVATLVGYRLDRTAAQSYRCGTATATPRGPSIQRFYRSAPDSFWLAEPAWAPYTTPRPLGLARGLPDGVLVDLAR